MKARLQSLLSGHPEDLRRWLTEPGLTGTAFCVVTALLGAGLYGATVGFWRAPLQSLYTAIKFPLLILLTAAGNALLNGLLAQLLGSSLSFRQTSRAILMSFALTGLILGGLMPVSLFVLYNTPPLASRATLLGHSLTLLSHVAFIAGAGVIANRRLFGLLTTLCPSRAIARRVLFGWLAGNLLLGSQLAWVLRPFIGSPALKIEFLRPDPLRGNFYEAVWHALRHLLFLT
jgi:hypothetical protein